MHPSQEYRTREESTEVLENLPRFSCNDKSQIFLLYYESSKNDKFIASIVKETTISKRLIIMLCPRFHFKIKIKKRRNKNDDFTHFFKQKISRPKFKF